MSIRCLGFFAGVTKGGGQQSKSRAFRLGKDQLLTDDKGSSISWDNYAIPPSTNSRSRPTSP
jgi:hypothetical protein